MKRNGIHGQFVTSQIQLQAGSWTLVAPSLPEHVITTFATYDHIFIHGSVAGGTLTNFKMEWSANAGGTMTDALVDADFLTNSKFVDFATTAFPAVASGANFKLLLSNLISIGEVTFWAKGTGLLTLEGSASGLNPNPTIM